MPDLRQMPGVTSGTLLGYLKGLGILSILASQDDAATAASWRDGVLSLRSERSIDEIESFLLDRWVPAPVVSPWNGGSGFFARDNTEAFSTIGESPDRRLDPLRDAIAAARAALEKLGLSSKPEPSNEKPRLLRVLRAELPDAALEWLDAAVIQLDDRVAYPPVLGSGGNDGRYDMANNYAQAVCFALGLPRDEGRAAALRMALRGEGGALRKMSLAHLTRDASVVNSPAGDADALGNPWDLVLAVHGLLLFSAGAARRLGATGASPVAPFTLRSSGVGYGSAVSGEKGRAELWMPIWNRPASLAEVQTLLREGRAQVGRRAAVTGFDAVRAAGALGVSRGVTAFERFAVLERAGQSNLTVPAGRLQVRPNPAATALATLDPWLSRVVRHAAGDIPQQQVHAIRALESATFALAQEGGGDAAVETLVALGRVETVFAHSTPERRPLGLRPLRAAASPWVALLDPDRVEHRLAVAFASLGEGGLEGGQSGVSVRRALVGGSRDYDSTDWEAPAAAPIVRRIAALHERRAHMLVADEAPFRFGLAARVDDLARLSSGTVDERFLGALVPGLAVLRWDGERDGLQPLGSPAPVPDPLLGLLLLAFHDPRQDAESRCVRGADWVTKLCAGRVAEVRDAAHLKLRLAGLTAIARPSDLPTTNRDGVRLAAALLARPARRDLYGLIDATILSTTHHEETPA